MTGAIQPAGTTARGPVAFVPHRYPIDHGIPIPPKKRLPRRNGHYGSYAKYPWRGLQPGDSFAIPVEGDAARMQNKVASLMRSWRRKTAARYTSRILVESDGEKDQLIIRVWMEA